MTTRTLVLHGALKKHGTSFKVDADTIPMLMRGIRTQCDELFDDIRQGVFKMTINGKVVVKEQIHMMLSSRAKVIHITPVVAGSGGSGKAIIGAVIIAFAIVASGGTLAAPLLGMASTAFAVGGAAVSWGTVAMLGVAMAASGVAMMMSPTPQGSTAGAGAEQRASFMFNGATNTAEQGGPVPVVYGRFRTGSTIISVDVSSEEVPV